MKNIHVLSSNPSRAKYIYITNDEEIKEGDYGLGTNNSIYKFDKTTTLHCVKMFECKKIILTTDQDLIKEGVQAIDDEFLEWFVKNPSCDRIKTFKDKELEIQQGISFYGIILPKRESKQTLHNTDHNKFKDFSVTKQETIEEAGIIAANICQHLDAKEQAFFIAGFQECIKWQQKIRA